MAASNPHIIFTVTNDLTYDQRMQRICTSLCQKGYKVTLVGREMASSVPTDHRPYRQVRLKVKHEQGKLFYISYNLALYKYLVNEGTNLAQHQLAICAIDLDTIVPVYFASKKLNIPRVYDAHELFSELTEVKRRWLIHKIWLSIERIFVCKYPLGYTVNQFIKEEFERRYGVHYGFIRNLPLQSHYHQQEAVAENIQLPERFILYQGAVNEGRGWEVLMKAMQNIDCDLIIAGNGNYFNQLKQLITQNQLEGKVKLLGYVKPNDLRHITPKALVGITLFDNTGLNQYYSLANRFFDYVQAGIPQICNQYPEYESLNNNIEVAILVENMNPESVALAVNKILLEPVIANNLKQNCKLAAREWCWEKESKKLVEIWQHCLPIHQQ